MSRVASDEACDIKKTRFGLYTSILKAVLGQDFVTGATEAGVLTVSRRHLTHCKMEHLENTPELSILNDVGGKL